MACNLTDDQARAIAIILKQYAMELCQDAGAICQIVQHWILDRDTVYMPNIASIQAQLDAYQQLYIKPINLSEFLRESDLCDTPPGRGFMIPSLDGRVFDSGESFLIYP